MNAITQYSALFRPLLAPDFLPPLGPGQLNEQYHAQLSDLRIETAFAGIHDHDMASCCLAGLWLLHGFLDESHKISQDIETTAGSYWHALMHRREPDFSNAAYWFRRVDRHPPVVPASRCRAPPSLLPEDRLRSGASSPPSSAPSRFELTRGCGPGRRRACAASGFPAMLGLELPNHPPIVPYRVE